VPPAFAQTPALSPATGLDIRLERDPRPGVLSSALAVNLKVTIASRGTRAAPADDFEVYAFADHATGTKTEVFPCAQEHDSAPEAPRGVYLCSVLVDHGGRWRFHGVVNQLRADPDDPPVSLGQAAMELVLDTDEVAPPFDAQRVKGRVTEVMLLWGHTAAAGLWLVAAALVAVLALPTLRRRLSAGGLHRLEDRFDLIVKSIWAATGLLVASGTYLLLNQTAYDTPFSSGAMDAVFRLPYARPYFLTLAAKLSLYAVMVTASAVLLREARRRLRSGVAVERAASAPDDSSPWRTSPQGVGASRTSVAVAAPVAVAVETPAGAEAEPGASGLVRLGAVVLVSGTVGLSLSITLLKYFHELIEAARAAL
jgi:hypothetical protein